MTRFTTHRRCELGKKATKGTHDLGIHVGRSARYHVDESRPGLLEFVNVKNFNAKISAYGFVSSTAGYFKFIAFAFVTVAVFGYVLRLGPIAQLLICGFFFLNIPRIVISQFKYVYERQRFEDLIKYMEQTLYSFKRSSKILDSLKDTYEVCDGRIREYIATAIDLIEHGTASETLYFDAFRRLERHYGCPRLLAFHDFMIKVETNGGDFQMALDSILSDLESWNTTTYSLQKDRKDLQGKVLISIVLSLGICLAIVFMLPTQQVDISISPAYQVSTTLVICLSVLLFVVTQKRVVGSWINVGATDTEEQILKNKNTVLNFDFKKARKGAIVKALMCACGIGAGFLMHNTTVEIVCGVFAAFAWVQPKMKIKTAKKRTLREIEKTFPAWLRGLALNLQTDNVYMALVHSLDSCPIVFKDDLEATITDIGENPNSIKPYNNFLKGFEISEIHSVFKTLYAITEYGTGDAERQIAALIKRNQKLVDKAEHIANEDSLSLFSLYVLLPMLLACGKLMADMTIFIMMFMKTFGAASGGLL